MADSTHNEPPISEESDREIAAAIEHDTDQRLASLIDSTGTMIMHHVRFVTPILQMVRQGATATAKVRRSPETGAVTVDVVATIQPATPSGSGIFVKFSRMATAEEKALLPDGQWQVTIAVEKALRPE